MLKFVVLLGPCRVEETRATLSGIQRSYSPKGIKLGALNTTNTYSSFLGYLPSPLSFIFRNLNPLFIYTYWFKSVVCLWTKWLSNSRPALMLLIYFDDWILNTSYTFFPVKCLWEVNLFVPWTSILSSTIPLKFFEWLDKLTLPHTAGFFLFAATTLCTHLSPILESR